jgi:hypothetical protein
LDPVPTRGSRPLPWNPQPPGGLDDLAPLLVPAKFSLTAAFAGSIRGSAAMGQEAIDNGKGEERGSKDG